ncbi:MAG: YidC/Oxa1 family membrane protein insertase [Armatimonadota bacterium]|nr:YidC/Oxa1 family membrane protein insertase [Armatimonadota bacterium]
MIDPLVSLLAQVLVFVRAVTGSSLAAIVILTVLIKLVLHPLTRKQLKSMKAMQALAPQLEVLRRKYREDPRQLNIEVMNLYRAHRVNPFSGCLPLVLQMPVLWALFALFRREGVFGGEQLFGVALEANLTIALVAAHPPLALIPVLTAATTYVQQMMTITDPQQQKMFIFMPLFIAWTTVAGWFPIGLSLYWIVSTSLYIVEYVLVVGRPRPVGVAPPKRKRSGSAQPRASGGNR